jgi:hypothetical protein
MLAVALACILSTAAPQNTPASNKSEPEIDEQRIHSIIAELPDRSALKQELLNGARGKGLHQPWMDDMRRQGIRRAVVRISINFDQRGRPKHIAIKSIMFYHDYDDAQPFSDTKRLEVIHSSGLEQTLSKLALELAAHGAWVDMPRPKPQPFDGGSSVEFFDDEWLPTANVILYCAGASCLSDNESRQHSLKTVPSKP